nr:MAG TPA: DNA polymerase III, alpha subunit [Caudoviricetes sp.]
MDYALELGQDVLAFTEHESVANAVKIQEAYEKRKENNPNFKVILGNEIYLVRNGLNKDNFNPEEDKYFHFILLAKNAEGHKQIREISTRAWMRSYMSPGMRRVPTYYQDLIDIINKNKGNVIASTACLGGQLPAYILKYQQTTDETYIKQAIKWLKGMVKLFGRGNFFLEMQPSNNEEQIYVNKWIKTLSHELDIPYIITCDAHYLKKDEAFIHETYLKSQNGEREVSEFYATTYLMETKELEGFFKYFTKEDLYAAYENIEYIKNQCEDYNLKKPLKIPQLPWKDSYVTDEQVKSFQNKIPNLKYLAESNFEGDKLLGRLILQGIQEKKDLQNQDAYDEINIELESVYQSSLVNKTHWSSYFLNLQKIIDTIWEAGSIVGCSRGSGGGFLILYVLNIIQINALRETTKVYPWRFLNPARVSVLDVDIDVSGLRRKQILDKFREVYGEDRVCNVLTLGTESTKSAILSAARGLGIDNDVAQYIASLVPSDRGLIRSLHQCYYGDNNEGMKPVVPFVNEMKQRPELWKVACRIEGLVCRSGIHAGGLVFVDEPFTETAALMRAPDGTIISQFDLHDLEKLSLIKYDLLSVEAMDKIQICLELLVKYGYVKWSGTLRKTYEDAIGIYNLERTDSKMWKMVWEHKIQSLFQMEKSSGIQGIALTHPKSVDDLATLNSVIRLMAQEKGAETPLEKYARFKKDISLWYQEMDSYGLTKKEQKILEPVLKISYGLCESQERFMMLVQIPECGGFDLNFADRLRKSVAKKRPEEYKKCEKEYFERVQEQGLSKNLCNYVWNVCVATSRGYGFNLSHTLGYSLVALQEMNLAYKYPIIFWNCANLIVDSGTIEGIDDKTSDYNKIARAVNKNKLAGIKVSLIDVNKSELSFTPDAETNTIHYGLGGLQGVGNEVAQTIIDNRPYYSVEDFMDKTKVNKTVMVSLIKSGAFDQFGKRKDIMKQYLYTTINPKKRLTMQNFNALIENNLVPQNLKFQKQVFNFNKGLKKDCKYNTDYFALDGVYYKFYIKFFNEDNIEPIDNKLCLNKKTWKKEYDSVMNAAKQYVTNNQQGLLDKLNNKMLKDAWNKYAAGTISHWEMESLGMYYHKHELTNLNNSLYDIVDYTKLDSTPVVDYTFKRNGAEIPIFKTFKIAGTVIAKDEMHSQITLLTTTGVVEVKMSKEYFSQYNKRISEIRPDGTKKIMEQGFFQRGMMLVCNGIRRGDTFVLKAYKRKGNVQHQLYKITKVNKDGTIEMTNKRYGEDVDN